MLCLIIFFCITVVCSDESHSPVRKQSEDELDLSKRIVLHSSSDLLHLIQNFSAELQAVKSIQAKQEALLTALKSDLVQMQNGSTSGGSTYVRWGRMTCPGNGTETVYSGYAAGSFYSHTGAAANYLCLTPNPLWEHYSDAEDSGAHIYGAEYEFFISDRNRFHGTPFFGKNLVNDDAPCSVCRSPRPSILMIPGRNVCYDGWSLEYKGYLVAGRYSDHATEYVCLDTNPETIIGGHADDNGALFYLVEGKCGSLECPPYVNGRELTCAVCSK